MTEKKPALLLGDEAVELKIKPKACVLCGKPYIPTGPTQRFCPACAAGRKHNPAYTAARTPGEVKTYKIEKPETVVIPIPPAPEEIIRQVIETPERDTWYECRIRRGETIMMDAKISPEMWAMILDAIK